MHNFPVRAFKVPAGLTVSVCGMTFNMETRIIWTAAKEGGVNPDGATCPASHSGSSSSITVQLTVLKAEVALIPAGASVALQSLFCLCA